MIEAGDTITIEGIYQIVRNPDRSWWQFWKPMWVKLDELAIFQVELIL